jgi:hypothetical protein
VETFMETSRPLARIGAAWLLLSAMAVSGVGATPVGAGDPSTPDAPAGGGLLVVAVPGLLWSDLGAGPTPAMDELVADSAVAGLATRVTHRVTRPGEAYATMGAGTRAVAPSDSAAVALGAEEAYGVGTAAEEYTRRTGVTVDAGTALLTLPTLLDANDAARFGATVGLVGQELRDAGHSVAVVANADVPSPQVPRPGPAPATAPEAVIPNRQAATALMGTDGLVAGGTVTPDLRRADPSAPFGWRLDPDAVLAAFDDAWAAPSPVVLVEASDLLLAHDAGRRATLAGRTALEQRALAWTDDIVAGLLERIDPDVDQVVLVAPTPRGAPALTVLSISSPHVPAGLLDSAQTRTAGVVTLADVGPTLLDLAGVSQPGGIEGRPARVAATEGSDAERIATLRALNADAQTRDALVAPVTRTVVLVAMALAVGLAVVVVRHRGARVVRLLTLWLAATVLATYLAAPLGLPDGGLATYLAAVAVTGAVLAAVCLAVGRLTATRWLRPLAPAAALASAVLAAITVSVVVLDSAWQRSTVFGDSPIVAGRFTGVNNLTFAQLAVAALLLAALVVRAGRLRAETDPHPAERRWRLAVAATVLGATVVLIGMPMWGADVGGVLATLPGFAIAGAALAGRMPSWRSVVAWTAAGFVAVVGLGLLDLTRAPEHRSHLGRLFERMGHDGFGGLQLVVERKLDQNLRTITGQPWTWLVALVAVLVAYLLWRHRDRLLAPWRCEPELTAAGQGFAVTLVLGFALNDSGVAVPGMMLLWALLPVAWVMTATPVGTPDATESPDTAEPPDTTEIAATTGTGGDGQREASTPAATSGTLVTTPSTPS